MSDAAAAPATATAQPVAPAPEAKPEAPKEHKGAEGTTLNRVKSLADSLRQRREGRIIKAPAAAEKPDAKADDKPEAKAKAEPEKREARDAKPEPAKDSGPQRDEHGRFTSAEGGKDADKPKPKDTPAKDDEPPPAAAKGASEAKDKAEPPRAETKPEQPPEKRQEPSQKGDSARLARTLVELRDARAEALQLRKEAARAKELDEKLKRAKGDELDDELFEELTGRSFEQMVKDLAANKVKFRAKSPLSPEMRAIKAEVDALKAERAAEQERTQREEARKAGEAGRAKEVALIKEWLPEVEDKFPYLTSFDDAADQVLDAFYAAWPRDNKGNFIPGRKPDVEEVAEQIEAYGSRRFSTAGGNKRAMVALLKDPKAKALAIEILGLQQPAATETTSPQRHDKGNQSAPAEGPRTLSNTVTQDVPALVKKTNTEEEERAALHARWRAAMRAQGR